MTESGPPFLRVLLKSDNDSSSSLSRSHTGNSSRSSLSRRRSKKSTKAYLLLASPVAEKGPLTLLRINPIISRGLMPVFEASESNRTKRNRFPIP